MIILITFTQCSASIVYKYGSQTLFTDTILIIIMNISPSHIKTTTSRTWIDEKTGPWCTQHWRKLNQAVCFPDSLKVCSRILSSSWGQEKLQFYYGVLAWMKTVGNECLIIDCHLEIVRYVWTSFSSNNSILKLFLAQCSTASTPV